VWYVHENTLSGANPLRFVNAVHIHGLRRGNEENQRKIARMNFKSASCVQFLKSHKTFSA